MLPHAQGFVLHRVRAMLWQIGNRAEVLIVHLANIQSTAGANVFQTLVVLLDECGSKMVDCWNVLVPACPSQVFNLQRARPMPWVIGKWKRTGNPAKLDFARQVRALDLGILKGGLHVLGSRLEPSDVQRVKTNSEAMAETGQKVLKKALDG